MNQNLWKSKNWRSLFHRCHWKKEKLKKSVKRTPRERTRCPLRRLNVQACNKQRNKHTHPTSEKVWNFCLSSSCMQLNHSLHRFFHIRIAVFYVICFQRNCVCWEYDTMCITSRMRRIALDHGSRFLLIVFKMSLMKILCAKSLPKCSLKTRFDDNWKITYCIFA